MLFIFICSSYIMYHARHCSVCGWAHNAHTLLSALCISWLNKCDSTCKLHSAVLAIRTYRGTEEATGCTGYPAR